MGLVIVAESPTTSGEGFTERSTHTFRYVQFVCENLYCGPTVLFVLCSHCTACTMSLCTVCTCSHCTACTMSLCTVCTYSHCTICTMSLCTVCTMFTLYCLYYVTLYCLYYVHTVLFVLWCVLRLTYNFFRSHYIVEEIFDIVGGAYYVTPTTYNAGREGVYNLTISTDCVFSLDRIAR